MPLSACKVFACSIDGNRRPTTDRHNADRTFFRRANPACGFHADGQLDGCWDIVADGRRDGCRCRRRAGQRRSGVERIGVVVVRGSAVKQLKQLIERLQKQLAQIQQQMATVAQRAKNDPAAATEQQSLGAQASTISAALSTAIAQLAQAIQKSSGSTSGSLVSTQA